MSILFLDIETTGLSRACDEITTIVWYHDNKWGQWISGESDSTALARHWNNAAHLVTYNGKCFDEPFICRNFEFGKHHSHVDLRYVLARQGIKGGLKAISAAQELERPATIDQVDGFLAVKLWNAYRAGSQEALDVLLYYNAWDVRLLVKLYNRFVSDSIVDSFPGWQMNSHWLDDFLSKQPTSGSTDYPRWQPRAPRSDKDLTLEIVEKLKEEQGAKEDAPWFGSVIAFTGQMRNRDGSDLMRKEARRIANSVGFVWIDEVKQGCTHLVTSSLDAATGKMLKARKLGITINEPDEFWDMVELG